jgi:ribosomal protein L11 methyltransferase
MPTIEVTCKIPQNHPLLETPWAIDDLLIQIVEAGALGTTQTLIDQFEVYIDSDDINFALNLVSSVINDPLIKTSGKVIKEQNWTQSSSELLEQLKSGNLTIIPVAQSSDTKNYSANPNQIFIIPGMGFGTGHHATTKTVIEYLQDNRIDESLKNFGKIKAADFGTGSGLLAIVIAKLITNLDDKIYAFDNDPAAIENAKENAFINQVDSKITFEVNDNLKGKFNLVTANIYAEVLCECYQQFLNSVIPGGILILSGIMEQKVDLIQNCFVTTDWQWIDSKILDKWATIILKRR